MVAEMLSPIAKVRVEIPCFYKNWGSQRFRDSYGNNRKYEKIEFEEGLLAWCLIYRIQYYYLHKKYITKNENSLFIDKNTNYCSIMDQHLVWYPLASMNAAILRGMDS